MIPQITGLIVALAALLTAIGTLLSHLQLRGQVRKHHPPTGKQG